MSTEEQLQLAISQNIELRAAISKLESQLDPAREERLRQMYQEEARRAEDFYRKMMDDMRESPTLQLLASQRHHLAAPLKS